MNYGTDYTVLTMHGLNNNPDTEDYLLYCVETVPTGLVVQDMGLSPNVKKFRVPVSTVLVSGTFTSSYVEVCGRKWWHLLSNTINPS